MNRFTQSLVVVLLLTLSASSGVCKPKYLFKIASIAPEGSVWVNQFNAFTDEVTEKTKGEVVFRIYPGGVMGDDQAMHRKMRVGQLHGGGFTMTGISNVVHDFRVLSLPFLFENYGEVDAVAHRMKPFFIERFKEKRLEFIAYNEVGFVYAMSTKPIITMEDLRTSKSWIPSGDPLTEAFMQAMNITPVQLSVPDVLASLQTGLIDTAFNSLYGSIILQWFTKVDHITDIPYGYAYGAFVLDKRAFDKLPKEYAEIIHSASAKHFDTILHETRRSNEESRGVLEKQGVKFVIAEEGALEEMQGYRDQIIPEMLGKAFSKESYELTMKYLEEYRASNQ